MKTIPVKKIGNVDHELHGAASFNIRSVATLLSGNTMVQETHRHDFFYILALDKGKGKHEIDFTPYKIEDHSIFFMRPGQVHRLELKAGSSGFLMEFTSAFYQPKQKAFVQVLGNASKKNVCQLDKRKSKKLFAALAMILDEFNVKAESYEDVIRASLDIFFVELARQRKNTKDSVTKRVNDYRHDRLQQFLELVETNISQLKQVSEYAELMNISAYQLNAITRTFLGKSCSAIIDEYILLEAKRFLLGTSNQVNEIAWHLGYGDISYFIRFFRKQTGFTPEAFRQKFA